MSFEICGFSFTGFWYDWSRARARKCQPKRYFKIFHLRSHLQEKISFCLSFYYIYLVGFVVCDNMLMLGQQFLPTMWFLSLATRSSTAFRAAGVVGRRAVTARSMSTDSVYSQYINGEWGEVPTNTIEVENPSTHEILACVSKGTADDAAAALEAAKAAQPAWEKTPAASRAAVLKNLANLMRQHRVKLATLLANEQAKTSGLAQVEIDASCEYLDYHVGWARMYEGEILQSDRVGEQIYLHRVPLGVSVGICPWNFPIYVMMRKIAPALVTGNTVVVKASEFTPLATFEIVKLFEEAGVPPGVINVVTGEGNTIGQALVDSNIPGIISMTGSVATGQRIMRTASQHMTKLSLELGGKAPCLVMADADLEQTVNDIWGSRQLYTGQICNSPERVYVHESVQDEFLERLVKKAESTNVGAQPDAEGADMCGLVNPAQLDKVSGMVQRAIASGAEALTGGGINSELEKGYHFQPTVLTGVTQSDEIMQQEIFGPVLPVMSFSDLDEAFALANDCEYGLTSSIFTKDAATVHRAMTELKFGETYINRDHFEAIQGFHAGWRKSGVGGADGKHGLYEYLGTRTVYWNTH